jgi:hypothetical protein
VNLLGQKRGIPVESLTEGKLHHLLQTTLVEGFIIGGHSGGLERLTHQAQDTVE